MSRYSQYNKNDTYLANLNYANLQKQRRNQEELKEIERDRIAMEKLQIELNQEKQLEKERKKKKKTKKTINNDEIKQQNKKLDQEKDNISSESHFLLKIWKKIGKKIICSHVIGIKFYKDFEWVEETIQQNKEEKSQENEVKENEKKDEKKEREGEKKEEPKEEEKKIMWDVRGTRLNLKRIKIQERY